MRRKIVKIENIEGRKMARADNENADIRVLWTPQQKEDCEKILLKALNKEDFHILIKVEGVVDADTVNQIAGAVFHQISSYFFRLTPFHFALWMFFLSNDLDFLADKRFFGTEEISLNSVPQATEELKESFERYADEGLRDFLLGVFEEQEDEDGEL